MLLENIFPCFLTFLARANPTHLFKFLIFKYSYIYILYISLSTVVLNSRDRYEKLRLPEFLHF